MRVIVNETQYNKILLEERSFYDSAKKWASYTADLMTPKIVKLNKKFKEDVFIETNLVNKLRKQKFLDKLPIESLIVNIHQYPSHKFKIETFYNPYWSRITEDEKGKKYIIDAEFDMEVSLPPEIDDSIYTEIHSTMVRNLTEQFVKTQRWFKENLNEQQLKTASGVSLSTEEKNYLKPINADFKTAINKFITIEKFDNDGTLTITDEFTQSDIKKLRDYIKTHKAKAVDIKKIPKDKLLVSLVDKITFGNDSLFLDDNLMAYTPDKPEGYTASTLLTIGGKDDRAVKDKNDINPQILIDLDKAAQESGVAIEITTARRGHSVDTTDKNISNHCYGDAIDIFIMNGIKGTGRAQGPALPYAFGQAGDKVVEALKGLGYKFAQPSSGMSYLWKTDIGGNHWDHIHLMNNKRTTKTPRYDAIVAWCKKMHDDNKGTHVIKGNEVSVTSTPSPITSRTTKVPWDSLSPTEQDTFTGIATGEDTDWDDKPQIYERNYKDGKLDGVSRVWEMDGQIKTKINYKDGKRDGLYREWYDNGQLYYEVNYKDDEYNGLIRQWYGNGQLVYEANYKDGKNEDGLYKQWHKNGQLEMEGNSIDEENEGLWRMWFENGQLRSEKNYKNGKPTGSQKEWDKTGKVLYETEFVNGTGLDKGWWKNGQLSYEKNYKDGKQEGLSKYWYENGQLRLEWNYKDGKYDGLHKGWYKNGQLKTESNYKNGDQIGAARGWYENGQLKWEEEKGSPSKCWDNVGKEIDCDDLY